MKTLRIGFLIDRWQPHRGGAEQALARFATHLESRGHAVTAVTLRGPRPGEDAPGRVHTLAGPWRPTRGGRERALGTALVERAAALGCDLTVGVRHLPRVDLYWPHGGSHLATLAAVDRSRERSPRQPRGRHRAFLALERRLLAEGGARRIVAVSALVHRELAEHYPACTDRLVTVPNGVDLDRFHPDRRRREEPLLRRALGLDPATPLFAFAARNPALKGLPALLDALATLGHRRWHLLAAGIRRPAGWRRRARRIGIPNERITWLPECAPERMTGATALVLPCWREPCGLTILESLAAGTPVITTDRAGASAYITTPQAGRVLPDPGDRTALAEALVDLLDRPDRSDRERATIRLPLASLDEGRWLAGLEAALLDLA